MDWDIAEGLLVMEERVRRNERRVYELEVQLYVQGGLEKKPTFPEILRWPTS